MIIITNYNNSPPQCLFLSLYERVTGDCEFIVHHSIKPDSQNAHSMEGEITT